MKSINGQYVKPWLIALLVLLAGCGGSQSLDIPPANPQANNGAEPLAWWSRAAMEVFMDGSVMMGGRSGFIAAFARDGQVVHATAAGYADIENEIPMTVDTRVRIASMTKPVAAVAAHILIEQGLMNLDDPVSMYIPSAANIRVATSKARNASGEIPSQPLDSPLLVRHALMFATGIGPGNFHGEDTDLDQIWLAHHSYDRPNTLEKWVNDTMALPFYEPPGQRWRYGGSADVTARLVEVVSGQSFDDFLRQQIFGPLGMNNTEFLPPPDQQQNLAKVYTQDENGDLVLAPKRIAQTRNWNPGGTGLVSTVGDYMRFALMLWNKGSYSGVQILKPETVEAMTRVHITEEVASFYEIGGHGWGLGLAVVDDAELTPTVDYNGDFWWAGYFGTVFFVSPETGLVGIALSQNEPGPYSGQPYHVHLLGNLAYMGL